jgi:hypothetical protein
LTFTLAYGKIRHDDAPVAQLDRVLPSEGRGSRFEFWQGHFQFLTPFLIPSNVLFAKKPSQFLLAALFIWTAMDKKHREAFSDGVLTIRVLELPAPEEGSLAVLKDCIPFMAA